MYKLVIIGCGRSGTTYSADVLRQNGYNVGHEKLAGDGGVGWTLLEKENFKYWNGNVENLILQVRDPRKAIPSMLTHRSRLFRRLNNALDINIPYVGRDMYTSKKLVMRAMLAWFLVNEWCLKKTDKIVRVEHLQSDLAKHNIVIEDNGGKVNSRRHPNPNLESYPYWYQVNDLAKQMGY